MSRRVLVSRPARADLEGIWDYAAEDQGVEAANHVIDSITHKFALLGRHPSAGRRRDEFELGVRSLPTGSYIIYYRLRKGGVEISRVFHAKRDQGTAWRGESAI